MTAIDRIIVLLAAIGIAALFVNAWNPHDNGSWAEVRVDGHVVANLDLRKNETYAIDGRLGPSYLEIQNGKIRFNASPCPGKQCLRMGWASRGGEFLACLPNRVSIAIVAPDTAYDAVNF